MNYEEENDLMRILGQKGRPEEAMKNLHRTVLGYMDSGASLVSLDKEKLHSVPAGILSYYGLCLALVENRVQEGVTLCKMAIDRDMLRADFYRNLGKVYLKAEQKSKAIQIFRKGLQVSDKNGDLEVELKKQGVRRRPALPFLSRGHFLNRYIGLLLNRLGKASNNGA
jgi:tetratricopeptide (TPR) repeat protein